MAGASGSRDLRIDMLRGLALWMIFIDHIPHNVFSLITFQRFGFSDAAEIFIFLSGISCSLAYRKRLVNEGFVAAQGKAAYRVFQIYAGYVFVVLVSTILFSKFGAMLNAEYVQTFGFGRMIGDPVDAFVKALYIFYTPHALAILPLYMVLVAAAPTLIFGMRRAPVLTCAMSAALWCATALVPQISMPNLVPTEYLFNPFSWQLLFCIGVWIGEYRYAAQRVFQPKLSLTIVSWVIIAAGLAISLLYNFNLYTGRAPIALVSTLRALNDGDKEGLLRLFNFLAIAYVVASYIRPGAPLLSRFWARPLIWCGQHSLEVFCLGAVLSYVCTVYFQAMHPKLVLQVAANLVGIALLIGVGGLLTLWRSRAAIAIALNHKDVHPAVS